MNDIVLNGETLEISRVVDSIEIEGFDHTFADGKTESKLVVAPGGSEPGPVNPDKPYYPTDYYGVNISYVDPIEVEIYIGHTDYVEVYRVENLTITNTNFSDHSSWVDTGIAPNSAENQNRKFRIKFNANPAINSSSYDRVVLGTDRDNNSGHVGIRELYFDNAGRFFMSTSASDSMASSSNGSGKDFELLLIDSTLSLYIDGVFITSKGCSRSTYNGTLGISKYSSNHGFVGTINYLTIEREEVVY